MLMVFVSCNEQPITSDDSEITIYGSVMDKAGQPIYNATVVLYYWAEGQREGIPMFNTSTGYDGNYEFSIPLKDLSDGEYALLADKDDYYSPSEYDFEFNNLKTLSRVRFDFTMQYRQVFFSGHVFDQDNNPLGGAKVQITRDSYNAHTTFSYTDANGEYKLELSPYMLSTGFKSSYSKQDWDYTIQVSKAGFESASETIYVGEDFYGKEIVRNYILTDEDFATPTQVTVIGKVTNTNGAALADAFMQVWCFQLDPAKYLGSSRTDSNGEYSFSFAPLYSFPLQYTFYMEKDGYTSKDKTLTVSSDDVGRTITLNFELTK